eukprot:gb/GECG01002470.1/.p1 GENE.gb/GECG01002470.1/~~gb/GECG01002470.1/.p1  ORF type:complete len:1273 (+),score=136.32 gb/GECG01002470.1/:1-3819(+)
MSLSLDDGGGGRIESVQYHGPITALAFHPIHPWLFVGSGYDLLVYTGIQDEVAPTTASVRLQWSDIARIHGLQFTSDGSQLVIYGDRELQVYNVQVLSGGNQPKPLEIAPYSKSIRMKNWVLKVKIREDTMRRGNLTIGLRDNSVYELSIDPGTGKSSVIKYVEGPARAVLYCMDIFHGDDGNDISFAGTMYGTIFVWNLESGSVIQKLEGHNGEINAVMYCGECLLSAGADRSVRWWSVNREQGTFVAELNWTEYAHSGRVWDVALQDDKVFSAGEDGCIATFDRDGRMLYKLDVHTSKNCRKLACFPVDDSLFATGGDDGAVRVWNRYKFDHIVELGYLSSSTAMSSKQKEQGPLNFEKVSRASLMLFPASLQQPQTVVNKEFHKNLPNSARLYSEFGVKLPLDSTGFKPCMTQGDFGNIRAVHIIDDHLLWMISTKGILFLVNYQKQLVLVFAQLRAEGAIATIHSCYLSDTTRNPSPATICCSDMCTSTGSVVAGAASGDLFLVAFDAIGLVTPCSHSFVYSVCAEEHSRVCFVSWLRKRNNAEEDLFVSGSFGKLSLWRVDHEAKCARKLLTFILPNTLSSATAVDYDRINNVLVVGESHGGLCVFSVSCQCREGLYPVAPLARATGTHGTNHITCVGVDPLRTEGDPLSCRITSTGADGVVLYSVVVLPSKQECKFSLCRWIDARYHRSDFRPALSDSSATWTAFTDEGGSLQQPRSLPGESDLVSSKIEGRSRKERKKLAKVAKRRGSRDEVEDADGSLCINDDGEGRFVYQLCNKNGSVSLYRVGQIRLSGLPSAQEARPSSCRVDGQPVSSGLQLSGFYLSQFSAVEISGTCCLHLFHFEGGGFKRPFCLRSFGGDLSKEFVFADCPQQKSKHFVERGDEKVFMLRVLNSRPVSSSKIVKSVRESSHGRAVTSVRWIGDDHLVSVGEDFNTLLWRRRNKEVIPSQAAIANITVVNSIGILNFNGGDCLFATGGGKETVCMWMLSPTMSQKGKGDSIEWVCSFRRENADLDQRITSLALTVISGVVKREGLFWEVNAVCFCGNTQGELLVFAVAPKYRCCDLITTIQISDVPLLDVSLQYYDHNNFCLAVGSSDGAVLTVNLKPSFASESGKQVLESFTRLASSGAVACEMGANAIDSFPLEEKGEYIVACGGDDGYLSLLRHKGLGEASSISRETAYQVSSSAIKGVKIVFPFIFAASLDQRLTIWRLDPLECSVVLMDTFCCSCPDVMNIDVRRTSEHGFDIIVCGTGVEFLTWSSSENKAT